MVEVPVLVVAPEIVVNQKGVINFLHFEIEQWYFDSIVSASLKCQIVQYLAHDLTSPIVIMM